MVVVQHAALKMFLGQKLAEWERTRQHFRSKQGLSCPTFFLSILVLNSLSDRSKPVQGFSHAVFYPSFYCFQPVLPFKRVQKNHPKAKLHHFWQRFNRSLSKPIQGRSTTLFFLSRDRFFLSSIYQLCQSTMIERVWTKETCLSGTATLPDYHHLNAILRIHFCYNSCTKYYQLSNT